MIKRKPARTFMIGAMAGSLALSSPFVFHVPVDAYTKQQIKEMNQLSYGDHGDSVVLLHRKLKTANYYPGEETDQYNALTEYAVKSFQSDYNLKPNGELNEATLEMLNQAIYDQYISVINHLAEDITFGEQSNSVKRVQSALKGLGLYHDRVDGDAGHNTKRALIYFNQLNNKDLDLAGLDQIITVSHVTTTEQTNHSANTNTQSNQSESEVQTSSTTYSNAASTARSYVGTPYAWGGTSPSGFDCSGFLQYVYFQHGASLPRTVNDIWNVTTPVSQPSVGDIVFFETYKPGPSHAGVYIGDGQFVHAGTTSGVTVASMSDRYWQARYLGVRSVN
ncbi:cell wall-associated NlpC family hydrolase [Alkalibacillus filiformis]|uniref:Cell wall-associated NlpC family hydrolase n=1 Tax=Alkalibacillus filiformis TaxID=200990 RepID=A0ABU0DQT6_9BACI|nr:NlpC/P60 family protein [Alkalibacillus filiformis]MDQ0350811.1 cell wall-associated NlpC family hydrolase [Alkalibacillus filiformis]